MYFIAIETFDRCEEVYSGGCGVGGSGVDVACVFGVCGSFFWDGILSAKAWAAALVMVLPCLLVT